MVEDVCVRENRVTYADDVDSVLGDTLHDALEGKSC